MPSLRLPALFVSLFGLAIGSGCTVTSSASAGSSAPGSEGKPLGGEPSGVSTGKPVPAAGEPATPEAKPDPAPAAAFDPTASPDPAPAPDEARREACSARNREVLDAESSSHTAPGLAAAADCYWSAGAVGMAVRMWDAIIADFPNAEEARTAWLQSARAYDGIDRRADAAKRYERYGSTYPKQEDAADALRRAACLSWSLGDRTAAERAAYHLKQQHKSQFDIAGTCGPEGGAAGG